MLFLLLIQEDLDLKVRINFTHKFLNFEMSLYNARKNISGDSLLKISNIPDFNSAKGTLTIELEKCHLNENDTESGETISNEILNFKIIKNDELVTFFFG